MPDQAASAARPSKAERSAESCSESDTVPFAAALPASVTAAVKRLLVPNSPRTAPNATAGGTLACSSISGR